MQVLGVCCQTGRAPAAVAGPQERLHQRPAGSAECLRQRLQVCTGEQAVAETSDEDYHRAARRAVCLESRQPVFA